MNMQRSGEARYVDINEAARLLSLKPRSVRRLIDDGVLPARKEFGRWQIMRVDVELRRTIGSRPGRPLRPTQAWATLYLASGEAVPWIDRNVRWRIDRRLAETSLEDLRARVSGRAGMRRYAAHPDSIARLRDEPGLMFSGISAAEAIGAEVVGGASYFEAYIRRSRLTDIVRRHHLAEDLEGTVVLRTLESAVPPAPLPRIAPKAAVALDLSEDREPRVRQAGRALLDSLEIERRRPPPSPVARAEVGDRIIIRVQPRGVREARTWAALGDVAGALEDMAWALVGGMMVRAHEFGHGRNTSFATLDVDAVIAITARSSGESRRAAERLVGLGFELDTGATYRFCRGEDQADLLVPDSIGQRADITTIPPGTAFMAPGGIKALEYAEQRVIEVEGRRFDVPLPALAGAILLKAYAASAAQRERKKHLRDLARLVALVEHPYEIHGTLKLTERKVLRRHRALTDPAHEAWGAAEAADPVSCARSFAIIISED